MALTDAEALRRIERLITRTEEVIGRRRGQLRFQADVADRATAYAEIAEIVAGSECAVRALEEREASA